MTGDYSIKYFGPAWRGDAHIALATQVPTPVGEPCYMCGEPMIDGDRGLIEHMFGLDYDIAGSPVHMECDLHRALRKASRCTRAEALESLAAHNAVRAADGLEPMWDS